MAVLKYKQNGKWYSTGTSSDTADAFSIVNGMVCTNTTVVGGDGWYMLEPAATLDAPYINEYGWKCVENNPRDRAVYEWIYRCIKESFSVPYRTIVLDGVEHRFATELTERDTEWTEATSMDTIAGHLNQIEFKDLLFSSYNDEGKGNASDVAFLCIPLIQFSDMTEQELSLAYDRVRLDNPVLCAAGSPKVFKDPTDNKILYHYIGYPTVEKAKGITKSIEHVTNEIDGLVDNYVKSYAESVIASGKTISQKEYKVRVAKVIHDYIVTNASMYQGENQANRNTPAFYQDNMYGVLDFNINSAACDGYTQAFNYFARLYGINAISMTADVEHIDGQGVHNVCGHIWSVVNFTEEYGAYPTDPMKWTHIDAFWDEPEHQAPGRDTSNPNAVNVLWDYFCKSDTFQLSNEAIDLENNFKEYCRHIDKERSYGSYPFDIEGITPTEYDDTYKYEGKEEYNYSLEEPKQ